MLVLTQINSSCKAELLRASAWGEGRMHRNGILTQSPCLFFQGMGDRACLWEVRTSGRLRSEGAGCGGGFVPDGLLGAGFQKTPSLSYEGL